jgi:outer membrane biosynthesis protein TonB
MMLRGLVIGLVCALGCSKGSNATQTTGPAGVVVELSGTASATRDGADPRPLAVDAQIFADDTVETGAASSVAIKLSHNNAALRLDAQMTRRVDQSLAWKAPKQQDDSVLEGRAVDDQTAAAGRHTEREAAGTASTAIADRPAQPAPAAEPAPTAAEPAKPPPPSPSAKSQPKSERKVEQRAKKRETAGPRRDVRRKSKGGGPSSDGLAESATLDVGAAAPGGASGGAKKTTTSSTRGGPIDVKKSVAGKIKVCHALADEAPAGSITAVVKVTADGSVTVVSIDGSVAALSSVTSCARKKIASLAASGAKPGVYKVTVKLR